MSGSPLCAPAATTGRRIGADADEAIWVFDRRPVPVGEPPFDRNGLTSLRGVCLMVLNRREEATEGIVNVVATGFCRLKTFVIHRNKGDQLRAHGVSIHGAAQRTGICIDARFLVLSRN